MVVVNGTLCSLGSEYWVAVEFAMVSANMSGERRLWAVVYRCKMAGCQSCKTEVGLAVEQEYVDDRGE